MSGYPIGFCLDTFRGYVSLQDDRLLYPHFERLPMQPLMTGNGCFFFCAEFPMIGTSALKDVCNPYFEDFNLMMKNCFVKEKGKKESLSLCGCAGVQKGNGINKIVGVEEMHCLCRSLFALNVSETTAASFAFAFARVSYKTIILVSST
jgi:hypothetical protein